MKIRAIVQARMLSSRLRGKSLLPVAGIPLLYRVINSVKSFSFIDEIFIATTKAEIDDPLVAASQNLQVNVFRGDSMNVLKRFTDASADLDEEDTVLRFTADNPFYDAEIGQKIFDLHLKENFDYSHIDGLSHVVPEIIKVRALREMNSLAETEFDKEHVTPFLRKNKHTFKVQTLPSDFSGLRDDLDKYLTIDTEDDLKTIEQLYSELQPGDKLQLNKIYAWLDKNKLKKHAASALNVKLGNVLVGDNLPAFIIAEIGQNHNGEISIAKQLIDMAVRCSANAVKFQKRDIDSELTADAYHKIYSNQHSFGKTYGKHREYLEFNKEQHFELKEYAQSKGISYFCTACDVPSVEIMEEIGVSYYKIASRDVTNIPLLERIAQTRKPVIISVGMAGTTDIEDALSALGKNRNDIIILHCISQYPADIDNVNLRAIQTLRNTFQKVTGFSDHTTGIISSVAAVVTGAAVIEKHITLSRAMKGTDHAGSLEEPGLKKMIEYIRLTERAIGDGVVDIHPSTLSAKEKLSRSITSKISIDEGCKITQEMLTLKSPGTGLKWKDRNMIIGKKAKKNIPANVTLYIDDVE